MLVLTVYRNEYVSVGDNVVLKLLRISGSRVSIGFKAPADVRIGRLGDCPTLAQFIESRQKVWATVSTEVFLESECECEELEVGTPQGAQP